MKVLMLTAAYQRPEIFSIFLENFRYLQEGLKGKIELSLLIAGDKFDPCHKIFNNCTISEVFWVDCDNTPLGKKCNVLLLSGSFFEFDFVFFNDTDTVFNVEIFDVYLEYIKQGFDYISIMDIYFMDFKTKKAVYSPLFFDAAPSFGRSIGPGRMLSREICEEANWRLWENDINIRLNTSMSKTIEKIPTKWVNFSCRQTKNFVMDIKSDQNLWPYSHYEKKGVKQDLKTLLEKYLPPLQTELILK